MIIYKLPKEVKLSDYLREKAIAYYEIQLQGIHYYVPITKQVKKLFKIKTSKKKLDLYSFNHLLVEDIFRDIIDSVYLQVRDVVCSGIEESLDGKLRDGFSKLFENAIHNLTNKEITKRLPYKNE
ncbi:MAG TPA: hypothetical protein VMZ91_08175 [Candidatus Paceibacterota bacterium]|nr:hypothetical protein [Candidatus Paceibacterota bacterium]